MLRKKIHSFCTTLPVGGYDQWLPNFKCYGDHYHDHHHHYHNYHDHHHVHHHLRPSVIEPRPTHKAQTLVLTRKQDALRLHFDEDPHDDDHDDEFDDDYYEWDDGNLL